jgi:3-phenylpropionate/cinnamic acid dioxygenase small subunit
MSSPPEEDIRRTLARYCHLLDDGRFQEWSELFVESGCFHVLATSHQGRDAIVEFVSASLTPERRGKHMIGNSLIELDSWNGTASVWSDYVFFDRAGAVTSQGRYHDVMERGSDKVWRFTLREIVFPGGEPELTSPAPAHAFE